MAFALTPATGQPIRPPTAPDVLALDFIVDPGVWSVTRGVGENSHIVTLRIIEAPTSPASPWNSSNEAPTGSWDFYEADFLAELITAIA